MGMKIALIGGTGDMGMGFAVRWAINHEIIIGSRKLAKAEESASQVRQATNGCCKVWGTDNAEAIKAGDVIVLSVPFEHLASVTSDLKNSYAHQVVVSPVVPIGYDGKYFEFAPPIEGSAALQARAFLPEGMKIVSAFHTVSASALKDLRKELKGDVLICGDDKESKDVVISLAKEVRCLQPLDAGPLVISGLIESLTPMLLNVARRNKLKEAGIKIIEER
jgi:NADPH-dependent F420 reductase